MMKMKQPMRILILEDNEDDAILEISAIEDGGYNVFYERVENPKAFIEALKTKGWDCVISDFALPVFTGIDALNLFKEIGEDIPFILVSGAIGEETAVAAMKAGAHDYVMKSNLKRLLPALERALKDAEIRRQKKVAVESMRFERLLLRTLIDNLPDQIYVKDLDCRRIIANETDVSSAGYSSESQIVGKTDLEIFDNEYGKRSHASDLTVIQSGCPQINFEEEMTNEAGIKRWYMTTKIPLRNADGNITGLVGIAHDITDRKRMELALIESEQNLIKQNHEYEALNEEYLSLNEEITESLERIKKMNDDLLASKTRAEESDKLKSAFLANMSHEIRTPLNAILGFSSFLKNPELSQERTEEYVEIIDASGKQLLSIINDILEISQIEAGQVSIHMEPENISKLLNELFIQFKKEATAKNLELILNINNSAQDIITGTDITRVRQVLTNLLNNALKFTHEGKIEFAARISKEQVIFYVKDTGIGIEAEFQSAIFEPFRQVESTMSRTYGGNGLGLSISRALVEKLGGKMWMNSITGKGSTFNFSIPYTGALEDIDKHKPAKRILDSGYDWKNHVILIAEDEIYNYQLLKEILSPTKVKVLHAKDGNEAVDIVKNNPDISLVIMDLKMPGMDGYKATSLIKELRPHLPVIAQTATVLNENKDAAESAGFDKYLSKPLEITTFMQAIDHFLD
jgi:PAS domain S-box-containing protein